MKGYINSKKALTGKIGKSGGNSGGDHFTTKYSTDASFTVTEPQLSEYEVLDDYPNQEAEYELHK